MTKLWTPLIRSKTDAVDPTQDLGIITQILGIMEDTKMALSPKRLELES